MKGQDPTDQELKTLKRIGNQMQKLNKEINKMGYDVYLSGHGTANVMKGPTHDDSYATNSLQENVVYHFKMDGWDGGDW